MLVAPSRQEKAPASSKIWNQIRRPRDCCPAFDRSQRIPTKGRTSASPMRHGLLRLLPGKQRSSVHGSCQWYQQNREKYSLPNPRSDDSHGYYFLCCILGKANLMAQHCCDGPGWPSPLVSSMSSLASIYILLDRTSPPHIYSRVIVSFSYRRRSLPVRTKSCYTFPVWCQITPGQTTSQP